MRTIEAPDARVYASVVSIWEIAMKNAAGRSRFPFTAEEAIGEFLDAGFESLSVSATHAATVEALPLLHQDPFDRLLVPQALIEPMRLISHDKRVAAYSDTVITW